MQCRHTQSKDMDLNAPGATGLSLIPFSIRDSKRFTTNDGYLELTRERSNLTILGDALVDHVLLVEMSAVEVKAIVAGELQEFRGDQIVLCAGAIYSPALEQVQGEKESLQQQAQERQA